MRHLLFQISVILVLTACGDTGSAPFNQTNNPTSTHRYLYVASGSCYGGGVTVSTGASNTVARFDLSTGLISNVVIDYNQLSPGDQPVAISPYDSSRIMVMVENTAGRRIDLVNKDGTGSSMYLANATALNGVVRDIQLLSDFSILASKSAAIEKFNAGKTRVTIGSTSAFVGSPAGSCATSTTLISSVTAASNGMIVYTHAAATPNNKIGVVSSTGYTAVADCKSGTAAPVTTALPTRALFHSSGKLLVAYGSTSITSNFIYSYDFNSTSGALTNATAVYNDAGLVVNGPSAMAEDTETGNVYVANAHANYNTIEKFAWGTNILTRTTGAAFIPYSVYTRCPADLMVGE